MLKVGELAALTKVTVRTLHHYDEIGLLRPSARSDAGYRLYSRDDVARLQGIQALRTFGMSLADIGLALDSPAGSPLAVVDRQLAELDERIADATRMRGMLQRLRTRLAQGNAPDMSMWLTTLEMTMERLRTYEKYFTKDELQRLPMYSDDASQAHWGSLVEQAYGLMRSQVPPDADAAKAFALRWLEAFERDTGGDGEIAARINAMTVREQDAVGMPAPLMTYIFTAIAALKRDYWRKYLRPEVLESMGRHYAVHGGEWTTLIEQVHTQAKADPGARAPRSRELADAWMALFHDMVGTNQDDIDAFRRATAQEPVLRMGPGIKEPMLDWLRRAMHAPRA
jgi:DNA-binding transcriptional MerR regulator